MPTAEIRPAATVMLVRDSGSGVQVLVQRRVAGMAFAGGMTAFPGGGVDPSDAAPIGWVGPDPAWWAGRFDLDGDVELARRVVVAAVREVYEETGVLLADIPIGAGSAELAIPEVARLDLVAHRIGLADLLAGGTVRADLLRPWARWVTPPGQSRRYDTFFLLAAVPAGQEPRLLTTEADVAEWVQPAQALQQARNGERALMPPTVAMLTDLAAAESVAALISRGPDIEVVTPELLSAPGEPVRVRIGDREVAALPAAGTG